MADPEDEELTTHACGPGDRAQEARLFNLCFDKQLPAATLAWRYDQNPHGDAIARLRKSPDGKAVGGYACVARRASPWGRTAELTPVGQSSDAMTHPQWRRRGIFSALDRDCMGAAARLGWPVCFAVPNPNSARIFVRDLGWEKIGHLRLWTLGLPGGERSPAPGSELMPRPLRRFPEDVGRLSMDVAKNFSFMVRRDAAYLDWRFLKNTSRLHRAFGVFDRQDHFRGYVVVQIPREGDALGYLVDVLGDDAPSVAAAIEGGLRQLATAGASQVRATAIDGTWWMRALAGAGFRDRGQEDWRILVLRVHRQDHAIVEAARDVEHWYFTDGDRDDETMG